MRWGDKDRHWILALPFMSCPTFYKWLTQFPLEKWSHNSLLRLAQARSNTGVLSNLQSTTQVIHRCRAGNTCMMEYCCVSVSQTAGKSNLCGNLWKCFFIIKVTTLWRFWNHHKYAVSAIECIHQAYSDCTITTGYTQTFSSSPTKTPHPLNNNAPSASPWEPVFYFLSLRIFLYSIGSYSNIPASVFHHPSVFGICPCWECRIKSPFLFVAV